MSSPSARRANLRGSVLGGPLLPGLVLLLLAGCGDDTPAPAPQSFAPLHYEYLPKLRLNVANIAVSDRSLPVSPQDIASSSPVVPAQALQQMARDRLFAVGSSGTATFTIDQASIVREPGGALDGQLAVHLDLTAPGGGRTGFAEARVARQHVPGSEPEDAATNLYALTRQMMDAMNVELEYQIRQSLKPFVVEGAGAPAPVAAEPLAGPGTPPAVPAPPPLPPAAPDAQPAPAGAFQDPGELPPAEPQQMSPPPGFLQPPPGTPPVR